jgi:polar amino acid transport system substrate-binding protein
MLARRSLLVSACLTVLVAAPGPLAAGPALDRIRDRGIMVAAADPVWPPFSWRDPIGEFHGFDVEVTREIADRLGVRAEFVTPSWEDQIAGAWGGQWDIAVTNMTPPAARAARLDFPAIYSHGLAALAVPADKIDLLEPEDASGLRIGVVEDTIYEKYLRREALGIDGFPTPTYRIEDVEIVAFADSAAPYRTVVAGEIVDAVIDDLIAVKAQIAQGRELRIVGDPLFAAPAAVAIETGDPEFAAELARIVGEMHADGTLRALSMKWFDYDSNEAYRGG